MRTRAPFYLALILSATSLPAFALPGETATVLEQCGAPTSQSSNIVPANSYDERTLTYGNLTMHFEPMDGRWSFTNAFRNDIALSRSQLAEQMPCFRAAMDEAAAAPVSSTPAPTYNTNTGVFGIPHFFLIAFLVLVVLAVTFWPRRRRIERNPVPVNRLYRRPAITTRRRHLGHGIRH